MKVAIYSPYLDTVGGGEKYVLTIVETLSSKHRVDVLLDNNLASLEIEAIVDKIERLHGLDLSKASFIPAPLGKGSSFFQRIAYLSKYDYLFYLTDGSIFFSTAKNSIIHFQVPFENTSKNFWQKVKLSSWKLAIYNSKFTKDIVEKSWDIKGEVVYPPVSVSLFTPSKKKKQILSVGRFFGYLKEKKHGLLIQVFKELVDENKLSGWSLHLAGGATASDEDYLNQLKAQTKGYSIFFHPNAFLDKLKDLYGESTIYWHAKGYKEEDPKNYEHFGITTVEAMSAGCIPVTVNLGGQKEIIKDGVTGFLWNNLNELKDITLKLIKSESNKSISENAMKRANDFSKENFVKRINELINKNG